MEQENETKKRLLLAFGADDNLSAEKAELKKIGRTSEQIKTFERGYQTYKFGNHDKVIDLARGYKNELDKFFFWAGYNYCSAHQEAIS